MAARYLLDTNLLVYALVRREPEKRKRARVVLRRAGGAGGAALPAQALSEFANVCLRKLDPRPDPAVVRRQVERLLLYGSHAPAHAKRARSTRSFWGRSRRWLEGAISCLLQLCAGVEPGPSSDTHRARVLVAALRS